MLRNLFKNENITYLSNERKYKVDNHHPFLKKEIKLVPAFYGTHYSRWLFESVIVEKMFFEYHLKM